MTSYVRKPNSAVHTAISVMSCQCLKSSTLYETTNNHTYNVLHEPIASVTVLNICFVYFFSVWVL